MKKNRMGLVCHVYPVTKILRIMKLTVFLTLLSFVQLLANNSYAQKTKLSVDLKNTSIEMVLLDIENQSNFKFIYNKEKVDVESRISLQLKEKTINETLDALFEGKDVAYTFYGNQVILTNKSESKSISSVQQKSVSGNVTDSSGDPLPGVSVVVKGTTTGTITDGSGYFSLPNIPINATLQFSFVGMKGQEITLEGKTLINVKLEVDAIGIEEVVAVGYGVQKKINVVGSIAQMTSKELTSRPIGRLSNALTGEMTGVTVISRSGKPGVGDGQIRVRGVGSINSDASALVVVDGIPLSGLVMPGMSTSGDGEALNSYGNASSGDMNSIDPNDIESISVLKDAASAAIYGSRAANGVILITTKKGKSGKAKINLNSYIGVESPTTLPKFANSWDYATAFNRTDPTNPFTADQINTFKTSGPNTAWLNDVLTGSGLTQKYDINIAGGQGKNSYFLSYGHLDQSGIVPNTKYKRDNVRVNLSTEVLKDLTVSFNISGAVSDRSEPAPTYAGNKSNYTSALNSQGIEYMLFAALRNKPTVAATNPDGTWNATTYNKAAGSPLSWLSTNSYKATPSQELTSNVNISWAPIKGLVITGVGGYNYNLASMTNWLSTQEVYPNTQAQNSMNRLTETRAVNSYKNISVLAEYKYNFKENNFDILGGYSFEGNTTDIIFAAREGFVTNDSQVLNMGTPSGAGYSNAGNIENWAMQSEFLRFKYDYKQKYLFEVTVRRDASSRFPSRERYAIFPAFAGGWRVSEEPFFEKMKIVMSNLKVKASWGQLGNQNIGLYPYQQVYKGGYNYPLGNAAGRVPSLGVAMQSYTDPSLHWETATIKDIGIETGFFKNALTINLGYFDKLNSDLLFTPNQSVSKVLGAPIGAVNTGVISNTGIEIDLGYQNKIGKLNYSIRGNYTYLNNKLLDLGLGKVVQANGMVGTGTGYWDTPLIVGQPMQMYYGYQTDGVFLPTDDISAWPNQKPATSIANSSLKPGDIRYKDISGPEGRPDGQVDPTYDRTFLGSRIPKVTYGFNINLEFKGFDMAVFLQGVSNVTGVLSRNQGWAFYGDGNIQQWQIDESYNTNNPQRYPNYPRLETYAGITGDPVGNFMLSDFWAISAAYLRVKNLQFGYSLPQKITQKIGMNKVRFYMSAENMFTFSNYREGWDPEINTQANGVYYPIVKSYTFGININL